MRGHNLLHDIESQPGPARFGGIEGLEDLTQALGWNTAACIPYLEPHLRRHTLAGHCDRATLGHRVQGILDEIEAGALQRIVMKGYNPEGGQTGCLDGDPTAYRQPLP